MRLGLLADVHEEADLLRDGIAALRAGGADKFAFLGDLTSTLDRDRITACAEVLEAAGVVDGVWGNHDMGLCIDPDPGFLDTFGPAVRRWAGRLKPRLEVTPDVLVCHVPPVVDVHDPAAMFLYTGDDGDGDDAVAASFAAYPQRLMFGGHVHRWEVYQQGHRRRRWDGHGTLSLAGPAKFYVTVAPVLFGWAAILDTATSELTALRFG